MTGHYNLTTKAVRARKQHFCSQDFAHDRVIRSGQMYVRSVIFPGHDANPTPANRGGRPYSHDLCAHCADQFIETRGLIAKAMFREIRALAS